MAKLNGKIAVITGGSSGIGLATARKFVDEGAYVFIVGRRQSELDKATALIGRNVTAVQGDVTSIADLDRVYQTVKDTKGHIDIVFANAGGGDFVPLEAITEDHFDSVFDLNVRGVLFTVQKALPLLRDGGSIILTGSIAGSKGIPTLGAYGAAKAAVRSFVRTWTQELKDRRIRANVISPGPVRTHALATAPQEAIEQIAATVPMGRIAEPDEIASVALFLASDDSSYITGIELFADGGAAQI